MKGQRTEPCRAGCKRYRKPTEFLCPGCYYSLPQELRIRLYRDRSGASHKEALRLLRQMDADRAARKEKTAI